MPVASAVEESTDARRRVSLALLHWRNDAALVIAGDGPYLAEMKGKLAGLPVTFLGFATRAASSSCTRPPTCSCSPRAFRPRSARSSWKLRPAAYRVLATSKGGPKEIVEDGFVTGVILSSNDAARWAESIDGLLNDEPRRSPMGLAAVRQGLAATRSTPRSTFSGMPTPPPSRMSRPIPMVSDVPVWCDATGALSLIASCRSSTPA